MQIFHTRLFARLFDSEIERNLFLTRFEEWKTNGENSSYYFGKDGYYLPIQSGLKHVHLVPILDLTAQKKWNKNWKNGTRRTSDTCLVYVEDKQDFLLITVLPEPLAHAIAAQQEEKHRKIMAYFWQIAEQFFYYRNIIA